MTHQESLFYPTDTCSLFYDVGVALYLACEGEFLDMDYGDKIYTVSQ